MTRIILKTFCIVLAWTELAHAENTAINLDHGKSLFNRLSDKYPQHFRLKNTNGDFVVIDEDSLIGEYIINRLSKKTPIGLVQWKEREPRLSNDKSWTVLGECDFTDKENGPELRFNSVMGKTGYPTESFWNVLIFEIQNLEHFAIHQNNVNDYKSNKVSRNQFVMRKIKMEYISALNTQDFQNKIWRIFCRDNKIVCSPKTWRFPDDTTFEQWINILENTKDGKMYLDAYK